MGNVQRGKLSLEFLARNLLEKHSQETEEFGFGEGRGVNKSCPNYSCGYKTITQCPKNEMRVWELSHVFFVLMEGCA